MGADDPALVWGREREGLRRAKRLMCAAELCAASRLEIAILRLLIHLFVAEAGASAGWREMGWRTEKEARGFLVALLRRR